MLLVPYKHQLRNRVINSRFENIMSELVPFQVIYPDPSQGSHSPMLTPSDIDDFERIPNQGASCYTKSHTNINDTKAQPHEWIGCRVVRPKNSKEFVVKYGYDVHPSEDFSTLYVAQSTTIPVPKIYAIYQRELGSKVVTYIVMQYVPGKSLLQLWPSMDEAGKMAVSKTLRTYFDELRQLKQQAKPAFFGTISGGPPLDRYFNDEEFYPGSTLTTSLAKEEELVAHYLQILNTFPNTRPPSDTEENTVLIDMRRRQRGTLRYWKQVLPTVMHGDGHPIFTHSDFQRKNVMLQPDGTVVLIDWEFASWMPLYWEYAKATCVVPFDDDWYDYLAIILDQYVNESMWLKIVRDAIKFHEGVPL